MHTHKYMFTNVCVCVCTTYKYGQRIYELSLFCSFNFSVALKFLINKKVGIKRIEHVCSKTFAKAKESLF
jgi:hypothetical protein